MKVTAAASNPHDLIGMTIGPVADWVLDDFNGTVLSFGCPSAQRHQVSAPKLAFETLKVLFDKKDIGANVAMDYQVYLSAWEVGSDTREVFCDLITTMLQE